MVVPTSFTYYLSKQTIALGTAIKSHNFFFSIKQEKVPCRSFHLSSYSMLYSLRIISWSNARRTRKILSDLPVGSGVDEAVR